MSQGDVDKVDDAPVIFGTSDTNVLKITSVESDDTASVSIENLTAGALYVSDKGSATITVEGVNTFDSSQLDPDDYWYGGYIKNGSTVLEGSGTVNFDGEETGWQLKQTTVEVSEVTINAVGQGDEADGIYASSSTLTVTSGSLMATSDSGNGISMKNSSLTVSGGTVSGEGDSVGINS